MDSGEISWRLIRNILLVLCFGLVIGITYLCLVLSEAATPFIRSFAVDSEGKVYISEKDSIAIYYDKTEIGRIDVDARRPWYFTVTEEDEIWCCTASTLWRLDRDGNELERKQERGAQTYSKLQFSFRDEDQQGNTYKRVSYLGRTKIVKNGTETVYQISVLSLFTKILLYVGVIGFPIGVISIVKEATCRNRKNSETGENL